VALMPAIQLNIGRQRVTRVVSPSEAAYIGHIKAQSKLLVDNMQKVINHINNITPEAIKFGLQPVLEESQRLVPVDTGNLKRSGFVETRRTAGGTVAAIGYGRYGRPTYAAFVHENLIVRHAPPTQAKFLEVAVNTKINTFARRVVLYMRKNGGLAKGG